MGGEHHPSKSACEASCVEDGDPMVWCCDESSGQCVQMLRSECVSGKYFNTARECANACSCCPCSNAAPIGDSITATEAQGTHTDTIGNIANVCPTDYGGTTLRFLVESSTESTLLNGFDGLRMEHNFNFVGYNGLANLAGIINVQTGINEDFWGALTSALGGGAPSFEGGTGFVNESNFFPITFRLEMTTEFVINFGRAVEQPDCSACFPDATATTSRIFRAIRDGVVLFTETPSHVHDFVDLCSDQLGAVGATSLFRKLPFDGLHVPTWESRITTSLDLSTDLPPCDPNGNPVPQAAQGDPGAEMSAIFEEMGADGM